MNQDYTGRRESYLNEGDVSEVFENKPAEEWPNGNYSIKQLIILHFFVDRRNKSEIIEITGVSRRYINKVISQSLKKLGISQ